MILAITGDRNWDNERLPEVLGGIHRRVPSRVILGDAAGVDTLARIACEDLEIEYTVEVANWIRFGRGAGPIRNGHMLDHKPDLLIYFHDDLASSKGTKNCIKQARDRGIAVENGLT